MPITGRSLPSALMHPNTQVLPKELQLALQEVRGRHGRKAVQRGQLPAAEKPALGCADARQLRWSVADGTREERTPGALTTSRSVSERMNVSGTGRGDHFTAGVNHAIVPSGHGVHCFSVRRRGGAAAEGPMCLPHTVANNCRRSARHRQSGEYGPPHTERAALRALRTRASAAPGRPVPPVPFPLT